METRGRKVARFCKGAKEPTAGGSFGWCQSIFKPVFKSFNMASDIIKLQFTTVASYETIVCDANLDHSRQRECERRKYTCVFSTTDRGATKIVERGEGNRRISIGEGACQCRGYSF